MDMSPVAFIILCIWKDFCSGILKLIEGSFIKVLHINSIHNKIYFSLIDINIRTMIILFSIHLLSKSVRLMSLCGICNLFT